MSARAQSDPPRQLAWEHLRLRLSPLRRGLVLAAAAQRAQNAGLSACAAECGPLGDDDLITEARVAGLVLESEALAPRRWPRGPWQMTAAERAMEQGLKARAEQLGIRLPLDALSDQLGLSPQACEALLLCALVELDRVFARLVAFVHDDTARPWFSAELLCGLLAVDDGDWLQLRAAFGPHGRLRRLGLLQIAQGAGGGGAAPSELGTGLRIAPAAWEALTDVSLCWADLFWDPREVPLRDAPSLAEFGEAEALRTLAQRCRNGEVDMVGLWGEAAAPVSDAVLALCRAWGRPLCTLDPAEGLRASLRLAAVTQSVLWVDGDALRDGVGGGNAGAPHALTALVEALVHVRQPVILSGTHAFRPTELLSTRAYAEVRLEAPARTRGLQGWQGVLPAVPMAVLASVAERYQKMSPSEQRAVARVWMGQAQTDDASIEAGLQAACRTVAEKRAGRFARSVTPRRTREDLVLPDAVLRQVLEIPRFYRTLGTVNDTWGFGHMTSGGGGLKALFTGDSGTGKTLAAEIIAGELGLPLLKVDLAQLVSKWVGETEKHIDAVFQEAEACHAVLLFDEADTLFGKRGEIQHGTDRYANLEVGFLLQRLEQFAGLSLLTSNLKDEIDSAFIRRFHVLLHFPRPQVAERRLLWRKAFPSAAPLHPGVDLDALAELDLTGAGIVAVGHTAALMAANGQSEWIDGEHIAAAVDRQFHRESRVLAPHVLDRLRSRSRAQPLPEGLSTRAGGRSLRAHAGGGVPVTVPTGSSPVR